METTEVCSNVIEVPSTMPSIQLNTTFTHTLTNIGFDSLSPDQIKTIFQDGRPFSHFIEPWLAANYPLKHITGCGPHDHIDANEPTITYDQKTFTAKGCKFMPSNMIGEGRIFNQSIFEEKAKKLIYIIVSNVAFPLIKVRFVRGSHLLLNYPHGKISAKDHVKFFA
jgi:hypothetical protein